MADSGRKSKKIKLIKVNTPSRPSVVLATSHPATEDERGGRTSESTNGRSSNGKNTIDVPIPNREQTILTYRLSPLVRRILSGFGSVLKLNSPEVSSSDIEVSVPVKINDENKRLGADSPKIREQHIPSGSTSDGAMELRMKSCSGSGESSNTNPVTGRVLK